MEQSFVHQVWQRAASICEYCQMPQQYDLLTFQIDHIIARKHHGTDELHNLALACYSCNNHKGPNVAGIDPETGEIVRLFDDPPLRHSRIPSGIFHFPSVRNSKTTCLPHPGLFPLLDHTQLPVSAPRVKRSQLVSSITREPPFLTRPWAKPSHSRRDQGLF